jgi:hypothetical protein
MYIMGTGSRTMLLEEDCREIYAILEYKIMLMQELFGPLHLISGMAEGWDEAIAKVGARNDIPYSVYLPNPSYGSYYWGQHSLLRTNRLGVFNTLVEGAAEVHTISQRVYKYVDGERIHSNMLRNQAMVNASQYALVFRPRQGFSPGTNDAIRRLRQANIPYERYPFI